VWKPRDGAGSTSTFRLNAALDVAVARAKRAAEGHVGPMVLQEFVPGLAASVAFLCGPAGNVPLMPAFQRLSGDGRFRYRGGELPIPPDLAERATRLAQRAVDCVPGLLGYVGVDLVLGDAADGSRDSAIEINPRLTTSYVGLRRLADVNLAGAMLRVAAGEAGGPLRWGPGRVRFGPAG
jgi:predicted ATP-grasp superfamily ATP-dependent carboligase